VSIRASRDETSISLIRPGDYVDVIGILGPAGSGEARSSVVLLQRVLVLAIGADTSPDAVDERKSYVAENLLTLSLTLSEAQILALAAERGKLAVAVRHPDDQQKTGVTDINFSSIVDPKERATIRGVRQGSGPPVNITAGSPQ